jgi:hypothetical protein
MHRGTNPFAPLTLNFALWLAQVVWNMTNLWANFQNHHPALITYDFDKGDLDPHDEDYIPQEKRKWYPLLDHKARAEMANNSYEVNMVGEKFSLQKPLETSDAETLRRSIMSELEDNLRLYRSKLGLDCFFAKEDRIMEDLLTYLELQDLLLRIDADFLDEPDCTNVFKEPDTKAKIKEWMSDEQLRKNQQSSAFVKDDVYKEFRDRQLTDLRRIEQEIQKFEKRSEDFPVKRGKRFDGITVHFCTSEKDEMRSYLGLVDQYLDKINKDTDNIFYTMQCYVNSMSGMVQSIWVYVGTQEQMKDDEDAPPAE